MFKLITENHFAEIEKFVSKISSFSNDEIAKQIELIISQIHADIPDKKRISYGRYSIIKKMGLKTYPILVQSNINVYKFAKNIYDNKKNESFVRSFAVQLISIYGEKNKNLSNVLSDFEQAATDPDWKVRECSAGFVRKLIKAYPDQMLSWYLEKTQSPNESMRRFTSESIRPVADNKWFRKNPNFCFAVLENLYAEPKNYPRTSVGNSLSDWARIDKERVYQIIEKLVESGNKNSYWIAYRACRNLVKTEPEKVMKILNIDEYRYKTKVYTKKVQ